MSKDRLLRDEVVDIPTMTDKEFVDILRAKLWRIHSDSIDDAEIAIENALEHIWSTMTRNARVEQQKRLYAESVIGEDVPNDGGEIVRSTSGEVKGRGAGSYYLQAQRELRAEQRARIE